MPTARSKPRTLLRALGRALHVRPEEGRTVAALSFLFFCIIFVFWCLKPLRTSGVVKAYGSDWYPLFRQGAALLMPLVVWGYSALADRLRREHLFVGVLSAFFGLTAGFWALFRLADGDWPSMLFYFYVDTYTTVAVASFWSYLNDVSTPAMARRLYGVIGAGGIAGGMAGAAASALLVPQLGDDVLLLPLPFLALAAAMVLRVGRSLGPDTGPRPEGEARGLASWSHALDGARLVARSRYLLAIAGMVLIYELVSTNIDFVFTTLADQTFADRNEMAAWQARVFFWANLVALVVQLAVVSWVQQHLGLKVALLFLPLMLLAGSMGLTVGPMLMVASFVIGSDAALSYSINQSSKEVLYTPTDRNTTYKAKAFIDMFVFRSAKAIGGAFLLLYVFRLNDFGLGLPFIAGVNVVLVLAWIALVGVAARHFQQIEAPSAGGDAVSAAPAPAWSAPPPAGSTLPDAREPGR